MSDAKAIRRFLELQYGTTTSGIAWMATNDYDGNSWTNTSFRWPVEADSLVQSIIQEDAAGRNVWYCVHLHNNNPTARRSKGGSVERRRLHADLDRELSDQDAEKIRRLGAWIVNSGRPGHSHVYVELLESVDVSTYHSLEAALVEYLGADKSKKSDNDLLRIPGTTNYMNASKPYPPAPVSWDGTVSQKYWDAIELGALLPEIHAADTVEGSATPIVPVAVSLPGHIATLVNTPYTDRSAKTPKIVNACVSEGLTIEQTLHVVLTDPDQKRRYQEKGKTFMFKEIDRLYRTAPQNNSHTEQLDNEIILGTTGSAVDDEDDDALFGIEPEVDSVDAESSWYEVDLDDVLTGTYVPLLPTILPRSDGKCLIYPGKTHSFHGEPDSGKSLVLQYACLLEIRDAHHVLYVDFEDSKQGLVNRMRELGADTNSIRKYFHYVRPLDPYVKTDPGWQKQLEIPYTLAVLDGVTESMSANGLDLLDNKAIANWQRMLPNYIVEKTGAAVVSIDHVSKSADTRGRTAIGGQHKMAGLTGAAYVVEPIEQPKKGALGVIAIRTAKDRLGEVRAISGKTRRSDRTAEVCRISVDGTIDGTIDISVAMFQDPLTEVDKQDRMRAMATNLIGNRPGIGKMAAMDILRKEGRGQIPSKTSDYSELWRYLTEEGYIEIRKTEGSKAQGMYLIRSFVPDGEILDLDDDDTSFS